MRLLRLFRARRRRDDGTSLVEVIVTLVLVGAIGALISVAVVRTSHTFLLTDDENRGLSDAKVIVERMTRDLREARGIVCDGGLADPADSTSADPLCKAHLQVWIDKDSDYLEDPAEIVTWRLEKNNEHYDVYRIVGEGTASQVKAQQASSLIVNVAFDYTPVASDPESARWVHLGMKYDAIVGAGQKFREVTSTVRLRNKGER